ncbi:MAG TPA: phospholipase D-like domain-containing protein [Steroidobacteraceae bacterium]|jgi:cardiolipin synthase|nr:phospholipase D-like domain-containing protein [Steroidobacteraceae bacterium]
MSTEPAQLPVALTRETRDSALLDRAFTRAAGAPLVAGNGVRLLRNAAENYPAWLEAIHSAREKIYFESYFIVDDASGREFAAALAEKARAGVRVRLVYDWMGAFAKAPRKFWRGLSDAGVQVRCFNPFRFATPFQVLHRDHRKMLAVDGRVGFVTGLCVGDMWVGDPARGIEPWRDTGIEVRGPAVCDIERAFAQIWAACGGQPIHPQELSIRELLPEAGDVPLRIVANAPGTTGIFRVDQLIAAAARRTLWLTDAYFAGVPPYVQALRAAALDGVDVRLLVPGASDIPLLRPLTQAGFRPLLEAGIRVFEWKGSMLHAKTAVADGRWARVGSSNLNIASWVGNYELDAVIEHEPTALAMEQMYLADLENSREIVLQPRRRRYYLDRIGEPGRGTAERAEGGERADGERRDPFRVHGGSASRAAAGALRIGRAVGAALTEQRVLAQTEARTVAIVGVLLVGVAAVGFIWPLAIAVPIAILALWMAISLFIRAHTLRMQRKSRGLPPMRVGHAESQKDPRQPN